MGSSEASEGSAVSGGCGSNRVVDAHMWQLLFEPALRVSCHCTPPAAWLWTDLGSEPCGPPLL